MVKRGIYLYILLLLFSINAFAKQDKLVYLVSDIRIPFWEIMYKGVQEQASKLGYDIEVLSANNNKKTELENTVNALNQGVAGLIISPINSSTAVTIIQLAKKFKTPVVVLDIGANSTEYVSYISSNNYMGAYHIGKVLVKKMQTLKWDKTGSVGIIAIPQKRANGKARTDGFMKALDEADIKGAGIKQQKNFTYKETYDFAKALISYNPSMKALWLQGSNHYQAALDAIADMKKEILLICFDAEPIFLKLIPEGVLVGAAMQQPFLMGQHAVSSMHDFLQNKPVVKEEKLPVLAISQENLKEKLPMIKRNVLGMTEE